MKKVLLLLFVLILFACDKEDEPSGNINENYVTIIDCSPKEHLNVEIPLLGNLKIDYNITREEREDNGFVLVLQLRGSLKPMSLVSIKKFELDKRRDKKTFYYAINYGDFIKTTDTLYIKPILYSNVADNAGRFIVDGEPIYYIVK